MARYFDKKELVLIALLILLFDFNGFCSVVIPHIMFENKQAWFTFVIVCGFLLVDTYIYTSEVNTLPFETVIFSNNKQHGHKSCNEQVLEQKEKLEHKMSELYDVCNKSVPNYFITMKKIALTTIATILIVIFGVCVSIKNDTISSNLNLELSPKHSRILRAIPLLVISILVLWMAYS
jgi:hypothetical protein